MQYESLYSKDQILEMYLNLAPYGGNLEGVAAASYAWFGHGPGTLSVSEAAMLAVLPQSPLGHNPIRFPAQARAARDRLIDRMERRGLVDPRTAAGARARPVPEKLVPAPFLAPHFSEWMMRCHPEILNLHTSLDPELQARAQRAVAEFLRPLRMSGVTQGAVVILDASTSWMLAMVGSADYSDSLNQGQVNGAVAPRSPGSSLKPFVYALALDRGLIGPRSLLENVPVSLGGYAPRNYDERYLGMIHAGEALATSRNVPAVLLERAIEEKTGALHGFLRSAGVNAGNAGTVPSSLAEL